MTVENGRKLLPNFHDHPLDGHMGMRRTLARTKKHVYWVGMESDVQEDVRSFRTCQTTKPENDPEPRSYHETPPIFNSLVVMDVIKLPKSDYGFNNALIMVDHLTKFVEVVKPIMNQSAEAMLEILWRDG